jgi:hypothetical protein
MTVGGGAGTVRNPGDDGIEIDAQPVSRGWGCVMLTCSKSRQVRARRGSGGNANRRVPVVGIVKSREPHAFPGVPEPL